MDVLFVVDGPALFVHDKIWEGFQAALNATLGFIVCTTAIQVYALLMEAIGPLITYTPAVTSDRFVDSTFIQDEPRLSGPGGVIQEFYQKSLSVAAGVLSLGIAASALLLLMGWIPNVRDAARDNFSRLLLYVPAAFFSLHILQLLLDVHGLLMHLAWDPPTCVDGECTTHIAATGIYSPLDVFSDSFNCFDTESAFARGLGLVVLDIALIVSLLFLSARYGVIILVACLSPLMFLGMAFNFTRELSMGLFKMFINSNIYQFLAAVVLRIALDVMLP